MTSKRPSLTIDTALRKSKAATPGEPKSADIPSSSKKQQAGTPNPGAATPRET